MSILCIYTCTECKTNRLPITNLYESLGATWCCFILYNFVNSLLTTSLCCAVAADDRIFADEAAGFVEELSAKERTRAVG